jgi:CheY-like chemotaxis protein
VAPAQRLAPVRALQPPEAARGGTVLVVEDDPVVRKAATLALKQLGYGVLATADGAAAVETFRQHKDAIGCVLCDVAMPGMSGWETLSALRQIAPGIPVILSSGFSQAQVMAGRQSELPLTILSKPYSIQALADAVARAMTGA